ncbi:ATP-binding protein [Actinomadura coerulea]|uniref:ATP-binding protein n=1 Tax=Actinomadura coerulea TaxID=46159 RepID=UPI003443BDFA
MSTPSTPSTDLTSHPPRPSPRDGQRVLALAQHLGAPRAARTFLSACLQDLGVPGKLRADIQTVVTELVTNAVTHGATASEQLLVPADPASPTGPLPQIVVRFGPVHHTLLLVEVEDACPAPPRPSAPHALDESGRGLLMVQALTSQWGWYKAPTGARKKADTAQGKVVWATFDIAVT